MKNVMFKVCSAVSTFALLIVAMNVNAACVLIHHQPKLPENAMKLRKF